MSETSRPDGREAPEGTGYEEAPRAAGRRGRWPDAGTAERLLDGEHADDTDPRTAGLVRLLAAARDLPPGRPQDEEAALAAFRSAAGAGAVQAARRPVGRYDLRRPRSVRAFVGGAAAVLALGGAAIAAQGGGIPHPFHGPGGASHRPDSPAPGPSEAGPGPNTAPRPTVTAAPAATPPAAARPGRAPHATVTPATTKGLCEAYLKAERGGSAPEPAVRARLAQAAGGTDRIDTFCAASPPTPAEPASPPASAEPATPTPRPRVSHTTAPHTAGTAVLPGRTRRR
jgi:hypothetical protein